MDLQLSAVTVVLQLYRGLPRPVKGQFRGIGEGWARFLYVGSTGGWEALAVQVFYMEEFLESKTDPYYDGVVDYRDRAGHCWNGDHTRPNALSRLRYNQMYVPLIMERIRKAAPPGADLTSWQYE
jgi:hypothetical protein